MASPKKSAVPDITSLLRSYQSGDSSALDALLPMVYEQLKRIAANQLRSRPAGTLSSTALVHDAFLKLKEAGTLEAKDRAHFFAIAAQTMRWLLTDYARAKSRDKRGGQVQRVTFDENLRASDRHSVEPSALVEALEKLEKQDPRLCRVVELRHLVGLTIDEAALVLGVSTMTVKRDWLLAKTWLARELDVEVD